MDIQTQTKQKMQNLVEHLKQELKNIRTGRANSSILDNVVVEVYGGQMKLKELANVTAEARQLQVSAFDKTTIPHIAKGIEKGNLNLNPQIDGSVIRINIPPMDENTRKQMGKLAKEKGEKSKVSIRQVRKDCNELLRKQKANSEIPEDAMKKGEKKIQELTDEHCNEVDKIVAAKEKDIMEI